MPLSQAEMDMFKEFRGIGTSRLTKRKRGHSPDAEAPGQPPVKRMVGDVGVVMEHCEIPHPFFYFFPFTNCSVG